MGQKSIRVLKFSGFAEPLILLAPNLIPGDEPCHKGFWSKLDPWKNGADGRNVNWTTPDALADMAGQSTFHSNRVWVRPVG